MHVMELREYMQALPGPVCFLSVPTTETGKPAPFIPLEGRSLGEEVGGFLLVAI